MSDLHGLGELDTPDLMMLGARSAWYVCVATLAESTGNSTSYAVYMGRLKVYVLKLKCLSGTWSCSTKGWSEDTHWVTWAIYETYEEAYTKALEMKNNAPRELVEFAIEETI